MIAVERSVLEEFRACVARRLGLSFENGRTDFLEDVLAQRMQEQHDADPAGYVRSLSSGNSLAEWRRVAERLTVTETYFFRNADHFRALAETVLPERIRAQALHRRLRLLSAGCASGEETYSLAMAMKERLPELASWDIRILGVDVNPSMLEKARAGLYSTWSLRETSAEARERYFRPEGREFRLSADIRAMGVLEERNLAEANGDLWQKETYDIIFCRNLIMYFVPEAARELMARMAQALVPGGFLFLGHAETLRGLSQDFHLCHTHGTFYYQRRDGAPNPLGLDDRSEPTQTPAITALNWDPSTTWVETIQKASEKIIGLAERSQEPLPAAAPRHPPQAWDLSLAMDLLRQERFAEALEAVWRLPPESAADPDVQLLHAVLLTNAGGLADAETVCRRLLSLNELNAGAHYLRALCREHAGDRAASEEHDRTAIYLDAGFAMPWLHLGLLAKRGGRPEEARRHLEQALSLLAKEDSSRILLFGGGFSRQTLGQLCRSEIAALKGAGRAHE